MKTLWHECKNILIIRPDNMGDIIMMTPAIRGLKKSFGCKVTIVTSKMGAQITPYIPCIDETIVVNLPWVKADIAVDAHAYGSLIKELSERQFDAAIISTVYSQNPLPAAMLAFMAGVPKRLGYCRENPYNLLTDWLPEKEPLLYVQHQVKREISLVEAIDASVEDEHLVLDKYQVHWKTAQQKLLSTGVDISKPWIAIHPGVSEDKREYPQQLWVEIARQLNKKSGLQILITGSGNDRKVAESISKASGGVAISLSGLLNIGEFISLIGHSAIVVSVNTATVHIAAATNTPVVVLYAQTNPQHTPWKVLSAVLPFSVPKNMQSKNQIVQYVQRKYYDENMIEYPSSEKVVSAAIRLLNARFRSYREKRWLQA